MNPYILMPQQQQDVSGLQPVYQNIAAQQLMHDQALAQQNQQVQQTGQKPSGGGGMNPMALAQMLRGGNPYLGAAKAMLQNGPSNVYGYGGMGTVPTSINPDVSWGESGGFIGS